MSLEESQRNWNKLGELDPMWAVLTDPEKKGGKWDTEQFFKTGEVQVREVLDELKRINVSPNKGCALDFGCGVGRLSQALAGEFSEVHGVDISQSMIKQAQSFNRFPNRCHYHLNSTNDLKLFEDGRFDFICTFIALQHVEPQDILEYLAEFVRVLRPSGIAVFQLLEPPALRGLVPQFIVRSYRKWKLHGQAFIWENGVSQRRINSTLGRMGAVVMKVHKTPSSKANWNSLTYFVSKNPTRHGMVA